MGKTQGFQLTSTVSNISWRIVPGNEGQADKNPLLINMGSKPKKVLTDTEVANASIGLIDVGIHILHVNDPLTDERSNSLNTLQTPSKPSCKPSENPCKLTVHSDPLKALSM